jgi:RND family efflux transporter MFP subunit
MNKSLTVLGEPRVLRRKFAFLLIAAGAAAATACGGGASADPGAAGGRGRGGFAAPVELVTLAEAPVEQTSEFVGTLKSRRSMTVQSQMEGFLLKINVKSGDRVKPGTVLFEIDATSQQAAVSSLESVRAAREADAAFARQQAARAKQLLAVGAMSQQEHDQAQTLQRTAEAQLKAVEEQIRQQRNEWSYSRVTAATDGTVGDIPVRVGDRVTRATPLTTIEDNSGLELHLSVPVQEAPRLKPGLPIHLIDEAGQVLTTVRVEFISPSVDDTTQTVLVKAPVGQRGGAMRADQFVRGRIVWSTAPALTVPLTAVSRISGQFFVFVAENANGGLVARQRPVVVGPMSGNSYLITSGLKSGDRVIVGGVQKIGDGAPVVPAPAGGGRGGPGGPAAPKSDEASKDKPAKAGS